MSKLEKVYEPRRLMEAWQQVKLDAETAGADRCISRWSQASFS